MIFLLNHFIFHLFVWKLWKTENCVVSSTIVRFIFIYFLCVLWCWSAIYLFNDKLEKYITLLISFNIRIIGFIHVYKMLASDLLKELHRFIIFISFFFQYLCEYVHWSWWSFCFKSLWALSISMTCLHFTCFIFVVQFCFDWDSSITYSTWDFNLNNFISASLISMKTNLKHSKKIIQF